jgi:DNA-binding transcriptional ArsR family regulator
LAAVHHWNLAPKFFKIRLSKGRNVLTVHILTCGNMNLAYFDYLRSAGIVSARREAKWMHYRIAMLPHIGAAQILKQTLEWLKEERRCRRIEHNL